MVNIVIKREENGVKELAYAADLAEKAQELTDEAAKKGQIVQNIDDEYGLLTHYFNNGYVDSPFKKWSGNMDFNDLTNPENNSPDFGNLAQLLSPSSEEIGCGVSKTKDNRIIIGCLLYPK